MFARIVVMKFAKLDWRDKWLEALKTDAAGTRSEPGCMNFHALVGEDDPNTVAIYQVYKDKKAFDAHVNSPHYLKFRGLIKDLPEGHRESVLRVDTKSFLPMDKDWR